jgi:hypothetical protein
LHQVNNNFRRFIKTGEDISFSVEHLRKSLPSITFVQPCAGRLHFEDESRIIFDGGHRRSFFDLAQQYSLTAAPMIHYGAASQTT